MVKYICIIYFILFSHFSFAQVSETFADGDFTSTPTWTVNSTSDFSISVGQLKSNNSTTPGNFYISTSNTLAVNCQWEFWCNLQFATSSTNYVDIYLTSDIDNLQSANVNGYFIRLGGTLDEICLYKRSGLISTAVKLIDGMDGSISSSTSNLLKIKITRSVSHLFTLERDMTGTGSSYVSEGSVTDATFTSSNSFGFLIQQSTASFVGKHFFDDIIVGPIVVDVTPPVLTFATPTSSTSLDVLFNENVDITSAQTISNYTINSGIGLPLSATRDVSNFKLVHLALSSSFMSGSTYTLVASNVKDIAGNPLTTSGFSFNYLVLGTPTFKDIVINELLVDPSPIVNLTSCEYIELYNRSSYPFQLANLKLTDNSLISTLGNYTLMPHAYVVICPIGDTAEFTSLGYLNKLGVSSFPSLTNSGKNIYLKTITGLYIDSVNYRDSWYKNDLKKEGGYSLEQINPNLTYSCAQQSNWIASLDSDGGTPGFINSVYSIAPDVIGPKIISITVTDSAHITLCFDDLISVTQLTNTSNYTISGAIGTPTLASVLSGGYCVTLSLFSPLLLANNYTITVFGLTDCLSNPLFPNTTVASYYIAKPFDILINELMIDPEPAINLPTEEYIELKNRTAFKLNLKNWSIATPTSIKKIPLVTIEPDSFIVLTGIGKAAIFNSFGINVTEVSSLPTLVNDGSTIILRDSNHLQIHAISYDKNFYHDYSKIDGGWSIEQLDEANPCGEKNNWLASKHPNGGTPGKKNSVATNNEDSQLPILKRISVIGSDTLLLIFNESLDSLTLLNSSTYLFDNGLASPTAVWPIGSDFKKTKLKMASPILPNTIYHCTIAGNVKDCAGNLITSGNSLPFGLAMPAIANDVVINELLFDPSTTCVDFVELYNRSNHIIDLKDLRIGSMDTITQNLINTEKITDDGYLLFPQSYVVLSENEFAIKQHYQTTQPQAFYDVIDLPSMNTDADVVTLSDKNGLIIDNVIYSNQMHFPLLVNTKGVSLERIDFNRASNDKTNWNSASENVGFATPAYQNSQYLQSDGGSGFSLMNPLFSPDNDGYNDVLTIRYTLNENGKIGNIYVFDNKGRPIKHLMRNQPLTQEGAISWNGMNDDNEKAAIGNYLIYIEIFDLSGKLNRYKLICTLAGKL